MWNRGWWSFSSTVTRQPFSASQRGDGGAGGTAAHDEDIAIRHRDLSAHDGIIMYQASEGGIQPMLLYDSAVSGNCYKVRLLLAHLGIALRAARAFGQRPLEPARDPRARLNPALRVPTIVLDDGRPLAESNAILWYFGRIGIFNGLFYGPELYRRTGRDVNLFSGP